MTTIDDGITYVDHDNPAAVGYQRDLERFDHVHVRGSDRCIKNRAGDLCPPGRELDELRAELADARTRLANVEALAADRKRHVYITEDRRGYSVTNYSNPLLLVTDLRAALGGGRDE